MILIVHASTILGEAQLYVAAALGTRHQAVRVTAASIGGSSVAGLTKHGGDALHVHLGIPPDMVTWFRS